MNQELKQEIEKVDLSYKKRKEEETKLWAGFDEEVTKLTEIVSQEFNRILKETDLSIETDNIKRKVKINNFEVNYTPQLKDFVIKIKGWEVDINGKSFSDRDGYGYCAYSYLEQVIGFDNKIDPKIREFKKDFNIRHIGYDCMCGSDHK